ncbi:hypothetical protein BROC_00875 [Candidatus Brocadiaceae bacterium]|nr:hypothetical protein BROC_00875 [Candidatus Brocadiaceae bacterium]
MRSKITYFFLVLILSGGFSFGQVVGDYQSKYDDFGISGNWNDHTVWDYFNGANWVEADPGQYPNSTTTNVTIQANANITLNGNYRVGTLTINTGGKVAVGSSTVRYIRANGNVIVNGEIGNLTGDGASIAFEANGNLSGSGIINLNRLINGATGTVAVTVLSGATVNLWESTTGLYNHFDNSVFNFNINSGATVNVVNGSVAIDGPTGTATGARSGQFTINGTLNVAKAVYATTNNTAAKCSVVVNYTLKCSTLVTDASGAGGHGLSISSTGKLEINGAGGSLGNWSTTNNTYSLPEFSRVVFSANGNQTIKGGVTFSELTLSGSGIKNLTGGNSTVNRSLTMEGTATFSSDGSLIQFGPLGSVDYNGTGAQIIGTELTNAPYDLRIQNTNGVSLGRNISVSGPVWCYGNLTTGSYTLNLGTSGLLILETDAARVIGNVIATRTPGTALTTFGNIGLVVEADANNETSPVTVTRITGPLGIISVGANNSIARRYTLSGGTVAKAVRINYFQSEDNGKGPNQMEMWWYNGTSYQKIGNSENLTGTTRQFTTYANISSLTGIITATDANNPLPVELTSFTAVANAKSVQLQWATASEVDNYGFEVERRLTNSSDDSWQTLGFIPGSGQSNSPKNYSYSDNQVSGGTSFKYRLKQIDTDGSSEYVAETEVEVVPNAYELGQNFPNPFNPSTSIRFSITQPGMVKLNVYNLSGEKVLSLLDEHREAGNYEVKVTASELASGTYFYRLEAGDFVSVKKMTLIK